MAMAYGDKIGRLSCKCSRKRDREFTDHGDSLVCGSCGAVIKCKPPIIDIIEAVCQCTTALPGATTFIVDSQGRTVCTVCGKTK